MSALIDLGTADGTTIGNPQSGGYFLFLDSNNNNLLTKRDSSGVDTIYGTGGGIDQLGWVTMTDETQTSGSPFSLPSNTDTVLTFTADSTIDTYAPEGYDVDDFFDDTANRITSPLLGASYIFRITFLCTPSANSRQLLTKLSIGTGVLSQIVIDQRSSELRISGSPSAISISTLIYSLDTFLLNGLEIILNANTNCDVYNINFVLSRIN